MEYPLKDNHYIHFNHGSGIQIIFMKISWWVFWFMNPCFRELKTTIGLQPVEKLNAGQEPLTEIKASKTWCKWTAVLSVYWAGAEWNRVWTTGDDFSFSQIFDYILFLTTFTFLHYKSVVLTGSSLLIIDTFPTYHSDEFRSCWHLQK